MVVIKPSWLSSILLVLHAVVSSPHPWEPYSENEPLDMRQMKIFHDSVFNGIEATLPMFVKMARKKLEEDHKKTHDTFKRAGRAGRKQSSEESDSNESPRWRKSRLLTEAPSEETTSSPDGEETPSDTNPSADLAPPLSVPPDPDLPGEFRRIIP